MGKSRFISKKDFALTTALGMEFALIMCLGTFGGYYLDKKINTFPLCLLVGAALAFVSIQFSLLL